MNQVTFSFGLTESDKNIEYAFIDWGNGEYTSMLKSVYDEQQAAQFLTNVPTTPQAGESA